MIKIEITADNAEDLRNQLFALLGQSETMSATWTARTGYVDMREGSTEVQVKEEFVEEVKQEEAPKTRSRKTKPGLDPDTKPEMPPADYKMAENVPAQQEAPAPQTADPLASAPAAAAPVQSNDPLAAQPAPVQSGDPLNGTAVAPQAPALVTTNGAITFEGLRHKIGAHPNKTGVRQLVASFKKEDGANCYGPIDLQEKDYADFVFQLDLL